MEDGKQIEAADATEWASALGAAKRSPHFIGMVRKHAALVRSDEQPLLRILDEFIQFAHAGAFVFALRADPEEPARASDEADEAAKLTSVSTALH